MKKLILPLFTVFCVFLTSCASTVDGYYAQKANQFSVKNIYLVSKNPQAPSDMDEAIRKDLIKRKINVVMGPDTNKVTKEDAIMKYNETWTSETASSLTALDIILFNPNGELVASSHWKNSKFSMLATLAYTVNDAMGIIFEKVEIRP